MLILLLGFDFMATEEQYMKCTKVRFLQFWQAQRETLIVLEKSHYSLHLL
jgi:hypothetical protein